LRKGNIEYRPRGGLTVAIAKTSFPSMKTLELEIPDALARQLEELVQAGLFLNPQEAVLQALQEFLRQHSATLAESQQLADVAWALREAPPK